MNCEKFKVVLFRVVMLGVVLGVGLIGGLMKLVVGYKRYNSCR